jgi:hypothetical protein
MLTYKQFLLESTKHTVMTMGAQTINGITIPPLSTYYIDENGDLDRKDGPAVIVPDGTKLWLKHGQYHREDGPAGELASDLKHWCLNGKQIGYTGHLRQIRAGATDDEKWTLLKASPDRNLEILNLLRMTKNMQEWFCKNRPDLITKIKDLDPDLALKYQHEQELGRTDL